MLTEQKMLQTLTSVKLRYEALGILDVVGTEGDFELLERFRG